MSNVEVLDARPDARGGYKVDVGRGERIERVSSEWFSRPDDERYLSLSELMAAVKGRADRSRTRTVESAAVRVEASRDNAERLDLVLPGSDVALAPTHWSFGQLAALVGAPAAYLRQLPAPLAGINLQYGLTSHRAEQVKTLETMDGRVELRAVTGPDYGRIYDHELVAAVQRFAGNGTGDTRWKVPGVLDRSTGVYNPLVDISRDTTTLYASDRDVFLFLVDDLNPIEAGRLPDGSPDLYFRGFYCWNSEVGAKTLGIASFYLRAVCQNRNLWGVEDFEEITIRHSKFAASRFAHQAAPALRVGNYVSAGTPLLAVVPLGEVYVEARYRETQREHMHVGTVAAGRIGLAVLKRLKPFDMHLHYTDRHRLPEAVEQELGLTWHATREEMYGACDVVTLNCPLHPETEHMINDETLKLFKRGAYLVNTARGKLCDRDAIVCALENGQLAGYAGDVWFPQPAPEDHPWRTMPHHGMTPHISGTSLSAQARYAAGTREILECYFEGRPIRDEYLIVQGGALAGTGAHSYSAGKTQEQEEVKGFVKS